MPFTHLKASAEAHLTTRRAIDFIEKQSSKTALDIGSGNGRDAIYLAKLGFEVTAVDISTASSARIRNINRINFVCSDVLDMSLEKYDLINASLVLPFLEKQTLLAFWPRLLGSLNTGGVICGHFFGVKDWKYHSNFAWAADHDFIIKLLNSLKIEQLEERLIRGPNERGQTVQKHNFSFIARTIT